MEYGELFLLERRIINNLITPKGAFKGVETEFFHELLHHAISDEIASVYFFDIQKLLKEEKTFDSEEELIVAISDFISRTADRICEYINLNSKFSSFTKDNYVINAILYENKVILYVKDKETLRSECSSPEKAKEYYLELCEKLK